MDWQAVTLLSGGRRTVWGVRGSHRRCSLIGTSSCLGNSGGILGRSFWWEGSLGGRGNIGRRGVFDNIGEGGLWRGCAWELRRDRLGDRATPSGHTGGRRSRRSHGMEFLSGRLKEREK